MRSYCRLSSNPLATLSTIHYQLSTIHYPLSIISPHAGLCYVGHFALRYLRLCTFRPCGTKKT
ncbi:MAG: hypothetical protein LBE12_00700 [Planctomycetaceae bacterium]|nr:hypothetical protein [Planctomycetaceae bacterium]